MVCTGYVRVFPPADSKKMEGYSRYLEQSKINFNEFTNGPRYPVKALPNNQGFSSADPKNMSRTNPPPQKAKAADLSVSTSKAPVKKQ